MITITTKTTSMIMRGLGYINATLFLVMITPLMYGVGEVELENSTFVVALKCMIILLPVIVTEMAQRLSKNLAIYLIACMGVTAIVFALTYLPVGDMSVYEFCYIFVIVSETVLLTISRMADRLKRVDDFLSAKEPSIFDRPKMAYTWYFVVMYLLGILFNSRMLCDISFWVAVIYMLTAFAYEYLSSTKNYLYLNNRTKGIPKKRLYGISVAMALIFLAICIAAVVIAALMSGYRRYTDVRHWLDDMPMVEVELEGGGQNISGMGMDEQMSLMLDQDGQPSEPSRILKALLWVMGAICLVIFVYAFVQTIREIFRDFRNALDENGDIIEEIKDDEVGYMEDGLHIRGNRLDNETMRIRRRYKKTIRKHRKDLPAPYESPDEIEANAGLDNNEDMKRLHSEYENARYGKIL